MVESAKVSVQKNNFHPKSPFELNLNQISAIEDEQGRLESREEQVMSLSTRSLQDHYKDFMKKKLPRPEQLPGQSYNDKGGRSPEFKDWLRQRFIEQCEKYLGVPYAKRYRKPDDPLYNAPLFLDCCALVRRAIYDLRNEFGFKLGPGNQAY